MGDPKTSGPSTLVPKTEQSFSTQAKPRVVYDPTQQRLMVVALTLLLIALGVVLYHDRDFWFPDTQEAETDQPADGTAAARNPTRTANTSAGLPAKTTAKEKHASAKPAAKENAPQAPTPPPMTATTQRTVLPPLEVEVVAGDNHRTVRPGNNSVRVDLQPGTAPQPASDSSTNTETAANMTSDAAERVQMSSDATAIVSRSVRPAYPLLARQMKVQGSVILQALISKDGMIQTLHVVKGPSILASAAEDAVRQWHFKPHYQGSDAVETQAKITVNFTISTN
jgi:periplasmic protein TonB